MNGLTTRLAPDTLGLEKGSVLAVTGSAGTRGGYAVQLAKMDGLTVIADAKESDEARVAGLGADLVLSRGRGLPKAPPREVPRRRGRRLDELRQHVEGGALTLQMAETVS